MEKLNIRIQSGILNKRFGTDSTLPKLQKSIEIIAENPNMKLLLKQLLIVAKTDASILITGPTGSGKEVFAEYTHQMSARSNGPFIVVNCAAIPENLLESELFGYEKGSFTGASAPGKKASSRRQTAARCFWMKSTPCLSAFRESCCVSGNTGMLKGRCLDVQGY